MNVYNSFYNHLRIFLKTGTVIAIAIICMMNVSQGEQFEVNHVAKVQITRTFRTSGPKATEIQVEGFWEIPRIDPSKYQVIDVEMKFDLYSAGIGWKNPFITSACIAGAAWVNIGTSQGSAGNSTPGSGNIANAGGWWLGNTSCSNSSIGQHVIVNSLKSIKDIDIYGTGSTKIFFWMTSQGFGAAGGGSLSFVNCESAEVRYSLTSTSTERPVFGVSQGSPNLQINMQSGNQRIPPNEVANASELSRFIPNVGKIPAIWEINGKIFKTKIHTFFGYRYSVRIGDTPSNGSEYSTVDGTNEEVNFMVDLSDTSDLRKFVWIEETKID